MMWSSRRLQVAGVLLSCCLVGLPGCSGDDEPLVFSAPEPRVATQSSNDTWDISRRPDDTFSTYHSLFARGRDYLPVALRDLGGDLILGRWTGTNWEEEVVGTTLAVDDGDQLTSGTMRVDDSGVLHALFTTEAHKTYYLTDRDGAWNLVMLPASAERCYDLALTPDGSARLLLADDTLATVVATVASDGTLTGDVVFDQPACGSLDVDQEGKVGVLLWLIGGGGTGMVARLYEKEPGGPSWMVTDVLENGYLCYECSDPEAFYVPQFRYRGDGVPVVLYIDSYAAVYLTYQGSDGLFARQALASPEQIYQFTRLHRSGDGTVGVAVILDYSRVGLATSSPTLPFDYTQVAEGVEMIGPQMAWLPEGAYIAFWDADGLWAVVPDTSGELVQSRVDSDASYGYYLGSFIGLAPDGAPQVFYNEVHVIE